LLHYEMSALNYLMKPPHSCATDDVNAMAFEQATKIIEGHDAVMCGIMPLSDNWSLEVKRVEVPLSKVIVPPTEGSCDDGRAGDGCYN
jgi:hypothetical protein